MFTATVVTNKPPVPVDYRSTLQPGSREGTSDNSMESGHSISFSESSFMHVSECMTMDIATCV